MKYQLFFRQEVLDAEAYHLDEHKGIKMNQNESPWDIPVHLKAKITEEMLKASWNRYPLGDVVRLKKKFAKHLDVWPDNLVFANGSNVLIQALVMATSLHEKIVVTDPTFSLYEIEGRLFGNKIERIALNDDFSLPLEPFISAIKKGRPGIIFIANPNAPTGNLFDEDVLREIIETAHCLVVVDEAYFPFSGTTVIDWVKKYDNLVVLRTFSKAIALAGFRLGLMVADSEVARHVEKCLLPFCINKPTLVMADCLLDEMDYVDDHVDKIIKERDRVYNTLKHISGIKAYPSATNFILFEVKKPDAVFKRLADSGIIVRRINDDRRLTDTLRVTISKPEHNDAFLNELKKAIR